MIFAADPHPLTTYLAGWFFLIAMASVSARAFQAEIVVKWSRIRREFLANFDRRADVAAAQAEQT